TYTVSDALSESPDQFVVTVGRLTAPEWSAVSMSGLSEDVSTLRLAIHPTTNVPYIVYGLPTVSGGAEADRKAVAAYLDGTSWKFLGSASGFSSHRVEDPAIAFDKNGVLY